jgi:hypothetical protein
LLTFGYDVEATGIDPFESKLITIQYRRDNQNHVFKIWDYTSERDLILSFLDAWQRIPQNLFQGGDYFVTYNFRLDGPYLLTRCLMNNLGDIDEKARFHQHLWKNLIHGPDIIDLDQLLGNKLTPFESWRRRFGLGPSKFKNSEIPILYKNHRYNDIEDYINDELVSLEKIYSAICKEPFYLELIKLRSGV